MPLRLLVAALACVAVAAPPRAQDAAPPAPDPDSVRAAPDEATALLHAAYREVFAGETLTFSFSVTAEVPGDSASVETGRAWTFVDAETEEARFWIEYDEGEVSVAAYDGVAYQVEWPRTRRVYVDSTGEAMSETTAGLLRTLHPAFGATLFYLAERAAATVVGPDAVDGRPCTRVAYAHPDLPAEVRACYDDEIALPTEVVWDGTEGERFRVAVADVGLAGPPAPGGFTIEPAEGYARAPYDDSDEPLLAVGDEAPPFVLAGEGGETVSLADFAGRTVLLDFWGTWCAPCVEAIPDVEARARAHPALAVLGVAAHEYDGDDPAAFVRERGGTYPVVRADEATLEAYRVHAFPTYVVVGPTGRVLFVGVPSREPDAEGRLDAFLAGLSAAGESAAGGTAARAGR